jgi:hypothetical protein
MCPFCVATMGLVVAGAVSTGGLATLALALCRKTRNATEVHAGANQGSNPDLDIIKAG